MKRIALLAGAGELPLIFARCAKASGEYVIGLAIKDLTSPELERCVDKLYWGDIAETKRALEVLRSERVDHLMMTGRIPKALIFSKRVKADKEAQDALRNTVDSKDYTIMQAIAIRLKREGVKILNPAPYFSDLIPKRGLIAKRTPTKNELKDIEFGRKMAKKISGLDIGQTVVIKKRLVLAVEAIEGTDDAIKRAGRLHGEGAVVVKMSRPHQDMRFDIPTIGTETIDAMIEAKAALLAIEAKKMLIVNRDEIVRKADGAGIAVVAI